MDHQIWKRIKKFFSCVLELSTFVNNIYGIFGGACVTVFCYFVSGIDGLLKSILWFIFGYIIGFLSKPIYSYFVCKFHFTDTQMLMHKTASAEEEMRHKKLWSRGSGSILTRYGDLFAIASRDTEYKKFVVIPVNTTFDTIVEDAGTQQQAPLVSPNTLHGMWIRNHSNYGLTLDDIQAQIEHSLHGEKFVRTISREQKPRGNCREYDIGTIAAVEGTHNTIFLLAALSAFDEKNRAHAGEDDIITVIKSIVHYCDTYGQQAPVYLPVMGTGLSRTHLTKDQAFHVILDAIKSCENEVNEKYTIVIYPGDRGAISIDGAVE